jgi:Family of unknown function (DUF6334)
MSAATTTAFNPALVPDRDAAYRLTGVFEAVIDGCRDELVVALGGASLAFQVDPDTDALEARFDATEFAPTADHRPLAGSAFDRFLGCELGWTWLAQNQQGYTDSAMLSFGGITPGVLVHAIGSSVRVLGIGPAAD